MIWHNAPIEKVLNELSVDREKGLHSGIADERIAIYKKNTVTNDERTNYFKHFLRALNSKFNYILLIVAVLLFVFRLKYNASSYFAPIFVLAVIVANALFTAYYRYKSMLAFGNLTANINPKVCVLRDGVEKEVPSEYLVPGDIIILKTGDYITADARIIECSDFATNEIAVTGETFPIEKHADAICEDITPLDKRANMIYAGSSVAMGSAKAVVVETGLTTEIGKTKEILEQTGSENLPINDSLHKIGKMTNLIIALVCVIVFIISVIRNVGSFDGSFAELSISMFTSALALAIAAIPESLPAVSVIVVALGVERILKNHIIIKKIKVLELLGKTNVICADKTGILTKSVMELKCIYDGENSFNPETDTLTDKNALIIKLAALCQTLQNDSTEESISNACEAICNTNKAELENIYPRLSYIPFDTTRKAMTTINMINGSPLAVVKGAPEYVIDKCNGCDKEKITKKYEEMSQNGMRVLCLAVKELSETLAAPSPADVEEDLTFLSLLAFEDPPRAGAVEGIKVCNNAGIKTVMMTGDSLVTATAIAKQMGLLNDDKLAITGDELHEINDDELYKSIDKYSVFARITPADKLRIIDAWQRKGMIVTVTGDNTEDADALSEADIGCVMGNAGTDVARGNADIVIGRNNFKYLISAIKESRGLFENIKKSVCYILGCNIAEILLYIICVLTVGFPPLVAVQLLLINLFTDSAPTISLATESPDDNIMNKKPITLDGRLFDFNSIVTTATYSVFMAITSLISFFIGYHQGLSYGMTMAFATLSISQVLHTFNIKSNLSLLKTSLKNNKFMVYSSIILIFLSMFLVLTPVGFLFEFEILSAGKFFISILLAVLILPFGEFVKHFFNKIDA
ncbi:MAG: cation-transporting P-type ATPase [Clostridia bacterium]|nr:cation-transporting P-type ATPase [Clostridia bacterium]